MLGDFLLHADIAAAIIALIATTIYAFVRVLNSIPRWIDSRLEQKIATINAEAMRDRAIADAIHHAASTNAQAMAIIQIAMEIIQSQSPSEAADELSRINVTLYTSQKRLNQIIEVLEEKAA